jgi:tetratricopeptide (TPR) repeat protein
MFNSVSLAYYNHGLQLARDNQTTQAVKHLQKALSYNRANISAWNLTGLCYYHLGKYKTAAYCWQQSLQESPTQNPATCYLLDVTSAITETSPYFSQMDTLCQQKKYGQAVAMLNNHICSHFAASSDLQVYLGVLQMLDGQVKKAAQSWETALAIDKNNPDAERYLQAIKHRFGYKLLTLLERLWKRKGSR